MEAVEQIGKCKTRSDDKVYRLDRIENLTVETW
jgi:hypothetical protein